MNRQARSKHPQLTLTKTDNHEFQSIDFLNSPKILAAKKEAEAGQTKTIGTLSDFDDWLHEINLKARSTIKSKLN